MTDLKDMIDDTTERLLKKIEDWEIPQSDKKYVTIEKEVWEATLRRSMENTAKVETLQKQLDIAKSFIFRCANDIAGDWYINAAKCVLQQIEELNK